jgi:enterochelin esterase-like enzyme
MMLKLKPILIVGTLSLSLIIATGYWYVFIAGAPQLDPPAINVPGSDMTFSIESFKSKVMGTVRQYGLILPPDYEKNPDRSYPVIFLLHGGHDDERAWGDKYGLIPVLHQLYDSNKLPPAIIITPDGNDQRGSSPFWDPDYFDGPNGKIGTLIGSELVEIVKSRYRTLDSPQFWAIGGLSSGGN